jgi:hypothetical protein
MTHAVTPAAMPTDTIAMPRRKDEAADVCARGAERQAYRNLARSLADGERERRIQADHAQTERQGAKRHERSCAARTSLN